jgi:ribonuclease-3
VIPQNERLEFLGDAVLSMVAALSLFKSAPKADEGTLTQLRASYVCEPHLAACAKQMGLGLLLRASPSMKRSGQVDLPSILADALEALFGAIYLDGGFEAARAVVETLLGPVPTRVTESPKDAKTQLQEWTQAERGSTPLYRVVESLGPPHSPTFGVEVVVDNQVVAHGRGPSKKEAAQEAARNALLVLQETK